MIKTKNLSEYHVRLSSAGVASAANDKDRFTVPCAGYIKAIVATFGTMGTDGTGAPTQDVQVDIKKIGSGASASIFASAATAIVWAHAGQLGTANTQSNADTVGAPTTNPMPVAKGDKLRLDILQILNGTSPTQPSDLTVWVVLTRGPQIPSSTLGGVFSEADA